MTATRTKTRLKKALSFFMSQHSQFRNVSISYSSLCGHLTFSRGSLTRARDRERSIRAQNNMLVGRSRDHSQLSPRNGFNTLHATQRSTLGSKQPPHIHKLLLFLFSFLDAIPVLNPHVVLPSIKQQNKYEECSK